MRFIVPLRASTGFRERFVTDVGHRSLRPLRYLAEREAKLPVRERTRYKGALRDWEITGSDGQPLTLRVAYIHSSEEATQVADARARALTKAEDALGRLRNGLGGRYYKTRRQVERRIGQVLAANVSGLIDAKVTTRNGRLALTWQRNQPAIDAAAAFDGIYALATNLPGRMTAGQVLRLNKDQQIVERRHRDLKQTRRNILAAFQGLGITCTHHGIELDRLTDTQQHILELLEIQAPWPQQPDHALTSRGKWG